MAPLPYKTVAPLPGCTVAPGESPEMPKKPPQAPVVARLNARLTVDTLARLDEARAALKRQNVWVSAASFVEVALIELLNRRDLADVLRKHGASARRES